MDRDPHLTCFRCRGRICTNYLTCDICKDWSSAQWEAFARYDLLLSTKDRLALQALFFPLRRRLLLVRGLLRKSLTLRLPIRLPPFLQKGGISGGGGWSQDAPYVASRGASSPPARRVSSERGGSASGRSSGARELASVSSAPSRAEDAGAALSRWSPVARFASSSVGSPYSSLHTLRGDESERSWITP